MCLIDAHCHLANLNDCRNLMPLLAEANEKGITAYLSSALRRKEVALYKSLQHQNIMFSAGIHPNFDECDITLEDLRSLCESRAIWAIGEIGLDRNNQDSTWQMQVLQSQLQLAAEYQLPVVLHIVGMQQQAWEVLREYPLRYLVHGYAGSVEGWRMLAGLDSYHTISHRILHPDKRELLHAILATERYLFETDITQYYVHDDEANPLLRLLDVVRLCSEVSGVPRERLIQVQSESYTCLVPSR